MSDKKRIIDEPALVIEQDDMYQENKEFKESGSTLPKGTHEYDKACPCKWPVK